MGLASLKTTSAIDNQTALRLKTRLAEEFRDQLALGMPTDADEAGSAPARQPAQIEAGHGQALPAARAARQALSALPARPEQPAHGFLGSSNLTFAGLSHQGELNVDVLDHDATAKLARWFDDRWEDRWCDRHQRRADPGDRGELGARGSDPAVLHLPEDRLPPLAGGARRPLRVPDPARVPRQRCSSSRRRP